MLISIYTKTDVYEIYARPHNLNQANYNQIYSGSSTSASTGSSANHLNEAEQNTFTFNSRIGEGQFV